MVEKVYYSQYKLSIISKDCKCFFFFFPGLKDIILKFPDVFRFFMTLQC